jgi:hypothetical protein
LVVDPFAGSCVTGEAAEKTGRRFICCEMVPEYVEGALGRFQLKKLEKYPLGRKVPRDQVQTSYRVYKPGLMWNGIEEDSLPADGGAKRAFKEKGSIPRVVTAFPVHSQSTQMAFLEPLPSPVRSRRRVKSK